MTVIIPIAVALLTTALFLFVVLKKENTSPKGMELIPYAVPAVIVALYALVTAVLGSEQSPITAGAASFLFTLGGCAYAAYRGKDADRRRTLIRRLALATVIVVALEMSVFHYSSFAAPRSGEQALDLKSVSETTMSPSADGLSLSDSADSVVRWAVNGTDTKNVAVTLNASKATPVQISVSARDKNFSTQSTLLYKGSYIIDGDTTVYLPTSSQGTLELSLTFAKAKNVQLTGVTLNAPKAIEANPLRLALLLILLWAGVLIVTFGLHRVEVDSRSTAQLVMALVAALLCIVVFVNIAVAHIGDTYTKGGLLADYDGSAVGKDPYYQQFDAFQKGQVNLDIPVDERLAAAGDLAYDSGYRSQEKISVAWDRAYYDGKYYSYFGTAPLFLFYYPVYWITGKVPTTAATCLFFSALFVIFGFMLIFRIARTVVKNANYLLTLLCASVLPLASGVYILSAYGDFYNLPKLCALAFLLLLSWLTIAGYEKPRWWIFLFCGLCVGVMLASRPNVLIVALGLAPLYLGVLFSRDLPLGRKMGCLAAFLAPIAAAGAGLMAYNVARFGAPLEFGAKYQLTVNNIAMNNVSLGMLGTAFYHYFLQPPATSPVFPFLSPQFKSADVYSRYFYITAAFGVMSLPLNWSLFAYPSVRRSEGFKPAYRYTLVTTMIAAVLVAWLNFAMAGLTISYVCDIAASVALVAVTLLLLAEKKARGNAAVHRGVYIGAVILLCATFLVGMFLLLGTEPLFVKNSMSADYGNIQNLFRF